ncbi:hypothetical protein ACJRO7_001742 [Eucalyptus globulus]|uniref:non-specific serine/threonine protein kinase n=1 Tax=Eucalyptus globulus TaxID=34317 RepID=A0ABD3LT00_EUCGL
MRMTDDFKLTSWASQDDPKEGNFTFRRDQEGDTSDYDVIQGVTPYWKSGVYGNFIPPDRMFQVISSLLSKSTTDNQSLAENYRLVMNYDGQIQYFKQVNESKPFWFQPASQCSVFNACPKFQSCNDKNGNKTMCKCLPGFELRSGGCLRKSQMFERTSDFLSLKMMKTGNPDSHFPADRKERCRRKCIDDRKCQAYSYSFEEHQRRGSGKLKCYTWSKDLENMQELAQDGHSLYVRVPLSDIGCSSRSCGTWGTNLVPYPLSTRQNCGDPFYSAFHCNSTTDQLYFEWQKSDYRVTNINPEDRTFTIQVNSSNCTSGGLMEINQQPNQSLPFSVSSRCEDFSTGLSEVKIEWIAPEEPLCNTIKDCTWPDENRRPRWSVSPVELDLTLVVMLTSWWPGEVEPCWLLGELGLARSGSGESTQENLNFRLHDSERRIKMWMDSCQFGEEDKKGIEVPFFDLEIILQVTNNFSDENKLGRGGFGPVYKVNNGCFFYHLGLLVGYCIKRDEKMLLYEYMPNRSLDSFIFDRTRCSLLTWEIRFEIILGIARGMLYLHQDSRLRIIHRDLKTSNVLLDEEMTPKISDFDLARIFEAKQIEASTQRVIGTHGYMSLEYALDGFFSFKSNVFSFGVVVLEIVSGKRNTGFYQSKGTMSLLTHVNTVHLLWLSFALSNSSLDLMDQVLHETYNRGQVLKCINVALLCVQEDPSDRPTMSTAVFMLGSESATLPVPKKPAFAVGIGVSTTASSSKPELSMVLSTTQQQGR